MKGNPLILFLLFLSCSLGAQSKWPDYSFCDKEFFKHVFKNFKVDDEKSKVYDIIHITLELNTNSELTRKIKSLHENQNYLSIISKTLDEYSSCFPISGKLELILYIIEQSQYDKDLYKSRILEFKKANKLSRGVLEGSVLFGRRISCGPQGYKPRPETEKPRTLSSTLPKLKIN